MKTHIIIFKNIKKFILKYKKVYIKYKGYIKL